jgi:lactate dehydrogenase-like 2-hydroxyacid dehydrogenase
MLIMNATFLESTGIKTNAVVLQKKNVVAFPEAYPFEKDYLKRKRSDIISLNVPYLSSTKHLINHKTIRLIKKGAILINTARGGLIDTDALVKALDEGILSGAGLDVLEEEELKNHALPHRENVIYTPHMAFYSREAVQRILDTTVDNIRSFMEGKASNPVIQNNS